MIEVSATSTCVLSFLSKNVYQGPSARAFLKKIDLSAGAPIVAQFEDLWDEIRIEILNRRHGVEKFCYQFLDDKPDAQVIHLGCGLDPLPIDLAEYYPEASFFDVDMANMLIKEEINRQVDGPEIAFITADLTDIPLLLSKLSVAGWMSCSPTLLVCEGISYYIPKDIFRCVLRSLQTVDGGLVFEYSTTDRQLTGTPKAELITDFFERLAKILKWPFPIERYEDAEVEALAEFISGRVGSVMTQYDLEYSRVGQNMMQKSPEMGAVRVAYIDFSELKYGSL